jgi:hypothetical protein
VRRILRWAILVCAIVTASAFAQESPGREEKGSTYLRWWAVLGASDPSAASYSLIATSSRNREPDRLFAARRGCYDGSVAGRFAQKPAGSYTFTLVRDDAPGLAIATLHASLRKDNAYTLSAVIVDGKPSLRIDREYPPDPEDTGFRDDVRIFNALGDPPLTFRIGEGAPVSVPVSTEPLLIPRSQLAGRPLTLSWLSRRKTQILNPVDYQATPGPVTVVFFRNHYNQAAVLLLSAKVDMAPAGDATSPAAAADTTP